MKNIHFFPQTYICTGHDQLCTRLREFVNAMKKKGYIYRDYNIVNQSVYTDDWIKYELTVTFENYETDETEN